MNDKMMASPTKAFSGKAGERRRAKIGAFGKALGAKINEVGQKLTDPFAAKWTVDNRANPASAYSMMNRKQKSMGQPTNFPK